MAHQSLDAWESAHGILSSRQRETRWLVSRTPSTTIAVKNEKKNLNCELKPSS